MMGSPESPSRAGGGSWRARRPVENEGCPVGMRVDGDAGDAKALRGLRRELTAVSAIDYFPGEARRQAETALAELESIASGEPSAAAGEIRRLGSADFSGRTWATRKYLRVDRMASAWLIRRFIDSLYQNYRQEHPGG